MVLHAVPDVAQLEFLVAHELVTGVQVAPRGHGHVLRTGAAAGDALINAGAALEVDHIVVEGEGPSLLVPLQHQSGQILILLHDDFLVRLRQGRRITVGSHHRLHAQLREAQIQHGLDVLQKVGVGVGEGPPHIVVLPLPGLHQLLELGNDLLPAAVSCIVHPVAVMDLLAAVQTQHHIAHLPVGEVDDVVVDEHPIGGQGKAEVLAPLLLHAAGIGHQPLHHVEIHQRLTAEEVYLQIVPGTGMIHEEVQRLLAHLIAHQRPVAVVLALTGEAVGAVEVAGVGHMEAQCLDDSGGAGLQLPGHGGKGILGEELPGVLQRQQLIVALLQLRPGHVLPIPVLLRQRIHQRLPLLRLEPGDHVIGHLVHGVDGARAHIQYHAQVTQLILMYHPVSYLYI